MLSAARGAPMTQEEHREPLSSEVKRLEGEVGTHAHHPLLHLPIFEQLKQRNVIRVAVLYFVVCWLILDPVHVVFHMLEVPAWANRLVVVLMALGFPAVVIFAWVYEITPEGLKPTVEVPHEKSLRKLTGRRLDRAIIAVLAVALAYFVVDKFWLSQQTAEAGRAAVSTAPPGRQSSAVPENSIAVLPFVDMSEKKDQEYFSDGLSEELIDLLTKVPDLRVPARTSSFFFKGKSEDIATIAQKLHVAHVLEGSVRKAANTIRVTAELVRADNGYHLWSETYDRDLKDVFKVQDEIAGAVVSALKVKIDPGREALNSHRTSNAEAHNYYLLGRQFLNRLNLDGGRRAVEAFSKAIALDPNYAAAYAGLAMSEFFVADLTGGMAELERAQAAADKAVTISPGEADGYAARGYIRFEKHWDWAAAQADYAKALALDPADSTVQRRYGQLLGSLGRLPEAIAATRKATELDPLSEPAWQSLDQLLIASGDSAGASEANRRALEIQPESTYALSDLGTLQLLENKAAEALATFRKVDVERVTFRLAGIAIAEHTLGHEKESQQALEELIAKRAQLSAYQIAEAFAWRGENGKAFEWLERAYQQRDGGLTTIKTDPLLASLSDDPRYKALLRKMNLPE